MVQRADKHLANSLHPLLPKEERQEERQLALLQLSIPINLDEAEPNRGERTSYRLLRLLMQCRLHQELGNAQEALLAVDQMIHQIPLNWKETAYEPDELQR